MKAIDVTKTFKVWLRKHWLAFVIAGLFSIPLVFYAIPPLACCFVWQRLFGAFGYLIQGIYPFLTSYLPELHLPSLLLSVLTIIFTVLLGIGAGLLVEYLWGLGRRVRVVVLVAITLNACVGLFIIGWADIIVGPAYAKCEYLFSDTNGVRLVAYPEYGALPGAHFFFFSTSNGGKTWRQFQYFRHDDPLEARCEDIEFVGDTILWKWSPYSGLDFVSLDGGKTWQ